MLKTKKGGAYIIVSKGASFQRINKTKINK